MTVNMGTIDRTIRAAIGVVLLYLAFVSGLATVMLMLSLGRIAGEADVPSGALFLAALMAGFSVRRLPMFNKPLGTTS